MIDDVTDERHDEHGVHSERSPLGQVVVGKIHEEVEERRDSHIHAYRLQRIVDGILALTDEIRQHHRRAVARYAAPCASHVAVLGHEEHVHRHQHQAACGREPRTVDGLVDELVPEREVKVDAHHYLGSHHDWHDAQTGPVALVRDDEAQDVDVGYHDEERKQREDDEELHRLGVRLAVVLVLRLAENERLVGVAERLRNHRHDHRNLRSRTIYAELRLLVGSVVEIREDNLIECLVEDAGYAQHQQRHGVAQHTAPQLHVEAPAETRQLAPEAEQDDGCTDEVDVEHHAHVERELRVVQAERVQLQRRQHDKVEQVEHDVQHDVHELQRRELNGLLLIAQIGERYALERVDSHADKHHCHPTLMVGVLHERSYLWQEAEHERHEKRRRRSDGDKHRRVDGLRILLRLVHVAEEGCLHTVRKDDKQQRRVGVDVRNDTILSAARDERCGLDGHQQIVDETARNAAQAVNGGVLC